MRLFKRKGSPYYCLTYNTAAGIRTRESTGHTTKAKAEVRMAEKRLELFTAQHAPGSRRTELTMEGLKTLWEETRGDKKSIKDDLTRFKVILEHFGPQTRLSSLTPGHVEGFKAALRRRRSKRAGKALSPATVNRHLEVLRAALNVADDHRYVMDDPMRGVDMLKVFNERDTLCTPEQYAKLIEAAYPKLRFAIILGYWMGMRINEIAHLRWDQMDLEKKTLRLHASQTKTGKAVCW